MIDLTSDQVFDAIEKIASTSSKNEKEALVRQYLAFPMFKRVVVAAYDPFITYGIAKVPQRDPSKYASGETQFNSLHWTMLDHLASRRLSGNAARDEVHNIMQLSSLKSAELLKRILKKDLRAGFTDGTVNRVARGTLPEFPYMRCSLPKKVKLETWPWPSGVISQEKADGMFANISHEEGGLVTITSRQGSAFSCESLSELTNAVVGVLKPETQTHGELIVAYGGMVLPREQGNGLLNSILQGGDLPEGHRVYFYVWDQIPLSAVKPKGRYEVPYGDRLKELLIQLRGEEGVIKLIPTRIVRSIDQAYAHYKEFLLSGKEGTIIKHPKAIWRDGTSKEQVKLKLEVDVDLKVIGFVEGTGKNADTFGSIKCSTSCGQLEVDVSGFTDAARASIASNRDSYIGQIMTVKANSVMNPSEQGKRYSLFLPRFVEFRSDKTEADTLRKVQDQFESAVRA